MCGHTWTLDEPGWEPELNSEDLCSYNLWIFLSLTNSKDIYGRFLILHSVIIPFYRNLAFQQRNAWPICCSRLTSGFNLHVWRTWSGQVRLQAKLLAFNDVGTLQKFFEFVLEIIIQVFHLCCSSKIIERSKGAFNYPEVLTTRNKLKFINTARVSLIVT